MRLEGAARHEKHAVAAGADQFEEDHTRQQVAQAAEAPSTEQVSAAAAGTEQVERHPVLPGTW
jgi:hypothetical protein